MAIVFAAPWLKVNTWRCWWPCAELRRRGFDSYVIGAGGVQGGYTLGHGDVLIIHATNQDVGLSGTLRHFRKMVRKVIVQWDDDYQALGDIQPLGEWYRDLMGDHRIALREADLHVFATATLAKAYAPHVGGESRIIRNWIPRWVTEMPAGRRDHPPMAGWFGPAGMPKGKPEEGLHWAHRKDVEWLGQEVHRIPRLGVVGGWRDWERFTGRKLDYRSEILWSPRELYEQVRRFTVGMAPVISTAFNRSKSWIKPLEFGALGIPTIASEVHPAYRELATEGYTGMELHSDPAAFVDAVIWWLGRSGFGYRNSVTHVRNTLREEVRENFTLEGRGGDEWERLADEILTTRVAV